MMQKESNLSKILSSFKMKLLLPILGVSMLSGCCPLLENYSSKEVEFYRDIDGDGIPDIYDPNPYIYNFVPPRIGGVVWFEFYHYNFPKHHRFLRPWEKYSHPNPSKNYYSPPRIKERDREKTKLRNDEGNRNNERKRSFTAPRNNSNRNEKPRKR